MSALTQALVDVGFNVRRAEAIEAAITSGGSSPTFVSGTFTGGLRVGFSGTPTADRIELGDADFYADFAAGGAGNPGVTFDTGDDEYFYSRSGDTHNWRVAGTTYFRVGTSFVDCAVNDRTALGQATIGFSDLYLAAGGTVRVNNVPVVTTQQSAIADLTWTYTANDPGTTPNSAVTFADGTALVAATVYEALDEIEGKVNTILAALRTHGLIAT